VVFDNAIDNGESETRASGRILGGEKRIEYLIEVLGNYPAARIGDNDPAPGFVITTRYR